ncbi:MAG TPA: bifunctional 3'-5' exonuclease/DNA polymerase [Naasia sp.]|jgi:DNA polymerase-1
MHLVLAPAEDGMAVTRVDDAGEALGPARSVRDSELAALVASEPPTARWVWEDSSVAYAALLRLGVRVDRAHDLRLCRAILRRSAATAGSEVASGPRDALDDEPPLAGSGSAQTLFDFGLEAASVDPVTELRRQLSAVAGAAVPGRIRLLLAAESAGGLAAAEMKHVGIPWDATRHDAFLTDLLGPRPPAGVRPAKLEELAHRIRAGLDAPSLNPDSPQELLAALRSAGLAVESTRSAELQRHEHPAMADVLDYKKRSRLLTANGWTWLDTWVTGGRFFADFLPGGVPSGRWAARGGGALQLPKQLRSAVRAEPGWRLVVADAAQLEPRVLAAMAGDLAMAEAGRSGDLYAGIAASGVVPDRNSAKYAMLGAIYGATAGQGGRLLPRLGKAFPRAMALVEDAARAGERGESVSTLLGRSSGGAGPAWLAAQRASAETASPADQGRARSAARERGRFTRNFVVQGTAAEWALCWLADLRRRLAALAVDGTAPELVYFLHDEVLVHAPAPLADDVAAAIREAAASAGRLLFGGFPIDFPLDVAVVDDYGQADSPPPAPHTLDG